MESAYNQNPQKTHETRAYKEHKKPLFIEAFRKTGTIVGAARSVGLSREVIYDWKSNDPNFAAQLDEADSEVTEILEASAFQRATSGVDRPIFYRGVQIGISKDYSDSLTMFLLRARNPQKYKDVCEHERQEMLREFTENTSAKLVGALRKVITENCPHCKTHLGWAGKISEQLKILAEKPS